MNVDIMVTIRRARRMHRSGWVWPQQRLARRTEMTDTPAEPDPIWRQFMADTEGLK